MHIWKAFQNTEEWCFPFLEYLFCVTDIDAFVLFKLGKWWPHEVWTLREHDMHGCCVYCACNTRTLYTCTAAIPLTGTRCINGKIILNKEYLWNYWNSVLQTWHQKCSSQMEQNNTCCAIAMTTVLQQVLC